MARSPFHLWFLRIKLILPPSTLYPITDRYICKNSLSHFRIPWYGIPTKHFFSKINNFIKKYFFSSKNDNIKVFRTPTTLFKFRDSNKIDKTPTESLPSHFHWSISTNPVRNHNWINSKYQRYILSSDICSCLICFFVTDNIRCIKNPLDIRL